MGVDAERIEWKWDLIWEMRAGRLDVHCLGVFLLTCELAGVLYAGEFGDLSVPR